MRTMSDGEPCEAEISPANYLTEIAELMSYDFVRFIPLTKGEIAVVDTWAYDAIVSMGKWRCHRGYAIHGNNGERNIKMHRAVLTLAGHDLTDREGDHHNGDTTDNRLLNLRRATSAQNQIAKRRLPNNSSGYIGVSWCKARSKWIAYIEGGNGRQHLGMFTNKIEAARARDNAALALWGHWPKMNLPLDLPYEYDGPPIIPRPPFESLARALGRSKRR
jgi:hypothetical protein